MRDLLEKNIFLFNSILMTVFNCVTPDVLWPPVVDDGDDVPTAPHDPLYLLHREVSHVPVIHEEETMTNLGKCVKRADLQKVSHLSIFYLKAAFQVSWPIVNDLGDYKVVIPVLLAFDPW